VTARSHRKVTVVFSDIVGFTAESERHTPEQVMEMLDEVFTRFDYWSDYWNVYKVETIGDAYMGCAGLDDDDDDDTARRNARNAICFARSAIGSVRDLRWPKTNAPLMIRFGVHSGDVMSGCVGTKMPRYCLFGDTVNTASRMESSGEPQHVQVVRVKTPFGSSTASASTAPAATRRARAHWRTAVAATSGSAWRGRTSRAKTAR